MNAHIAANSDPASGLRVLTNDEIDSVGGAISHTVIFDIVFFGFIAANTFWTTLKSIFC